jgi:hypothetical protein
LAKGYWLVKKLPWDSPERVDAYLRGIGQWLIFFLFFALLFGGAQLVSDDDKYWRIAGWVCILIAAPVAVATIDRWSKLLPVLFGYAALHSLVIPFDGHSAKNPAPVSSAERFLLFVILIACANLSIAFYKRKRLTITDRFCVVLIMVFYAADIGLKALRSRSVGRLTGTDYYNDSLLVFSCTLACLLLNWGYNRVHSRMRRKSIKSTAY